MNNKISSAVSAEDMVKQIERYARMVKISLSENEQAEILKHSNMLIESFSALDNIDTENVQEMVTVLDIKNVLRDDIVKKTIPREVLLSNAPEQYGGYFQVPKTID